jgi:DUF4097 and DUF4098 domain-containing protein YvlB
MLTHLIAGTVAALSLAQAGDTTFAVNRDARVSIDMNAGSIEIRAWDRGEIRVQSADSDEGAVEVSQSGSVIRIRPRGYWEDDEADLIFTIPTSMAVEVSSGEGDIRVSGTRASVAAETLEGDVEIRDAAGAVAVQTVEGDIEIAAVRGAVAVESGDGEIRLSQVSGPIAAEGIDGDITLRGIDSESVEVSTVDGDVWYDGTVRDGGEYSLVTHDGDVTFSVPEGAGLTVSVATFDGSLHPSFPVTLRGSVGQLTEFTIGDGSARVELETFDGDIYLIRPGERSPEPR